MARALQPQWAQRRDAYEAESRGEDPTPYIQTAPGGTPGRIQGVSALQRIAAMQAYRARTALPQRRAAQPVTDSRKSAVSDLVSQGVTDPNQALNYLNFTQDGRRVGDFTLDEVRGHMPSSNTGDLATQQFENRRKRLVGGGISAPEADREARNEFQASPSFVGPRNVNKPYRAAFVGPRNITPGKDQGTLATVRESMKRRPRVQY